MPCGGPYPDNNDPYAQIEADKLAKKVDGLEQMVRAIEGRDRSRVQFLEQALCLLMTRIDVLRTTNVGMYKQLLDDANWVEAGITREDLMAWWDHHQKVDSARRAYEQSVKTKNGV